MKKVFILIVLAIVISSCIGKGDVQNNLNGTENLPEELRGLKVYTVGIGGDTFVRVGVLNGSVNSITSKDVAGRNQTTTTIIINQNNKQRIIVAKSIISENDSILVIRK